MPFVISQQGQIQKLKKGGGQVGGGAACVVRKF